MPCRKLSGLMRPFCALAALATLAWAPVAVSADFDRSKYISPDEVRPGMKGYGRTVMSGAKIETFQIEVIGVMRNAYYPKQDIVLVRCSGLNLEHSGIIGGMSGSPCYIVDEGSGQGRMLGAVAYGWTFNKDPVCGVQPIVQMLPISEVREPKSPPATQVAADEPRKGGGGLSLGEIVAKVWSEPIDPASPLSVLNDEIAQVNAARPKAEPMGGQLRPLPVPLMISGGGDRSISRLRSSFERLGLEPVMSGGLSPATREAMDDVKLEPGSALTVPLMTGDLMMEGLGTCTEVIGGRVLGFGHPMFGQGAVELPMATGVVHTVISSVSRSNKLGAAIKPVGTLYGDENTGIFGVVGKSPDMIPLEVTVTDLRGKQTYHYNVAREDSFTPMLLASGATESVYAHSEPPEEHTVRYSVQLDFEGLGSFKSSNFISQGGVGGAGSDLMVPAMTLMNSPYGKAKVTRATVDITVEKGARTAIFDEAILPQTAFKPGEKVEARVRWFHYRGKPVYTTQTYALTLPEDLPDGEYMFTVSSSRSHLSALRSEKPHLFRAESLPEILAAYNRIGAYSDNAVYLRLGLPTGGLTVDKVEMPELPSFRRQILADSRRTDIQRFSDALVQRYETDFSVSGERAFRIRVSRRADQ